MYNSAFFNSRDGDRVYKAEDFAEFFSSLIGNGVFPNPSTGLQVREGGDGMKIIVQTGKAWINGYFLHNKSDHVFTLDGADGVLRRVDRVVVRWSLLDREMSLTVKKGSLSTTPSPPILRRDAEIYELALADIAVNAGVVVITQANITDQRLNSALCGIVKGTIEEIDTTTLFNQFESWFAGYRTEKDEEFTAWFDAIKDILDENTAAHLLAMVNGKQDVITADGLLKGSGGLVTSAVPEVDYITPIMAARVMHTRYDYYINAVTGDDNNDGLSAATAWKTVNKVNAKLAEFDILRRQLFFNFAPGDYSETLEVRSKVGDIRIQASSVNKETVKFTRINASLNAGNVSINYVTSDYISIEKSHYADIFGCIIEKSIMITGSHARVESCTVRNTSNGIYANASSLVYSSGNSGTGNSSGLTSNASIIIKNGTQPSGTVAETKTYGGQIF